MTTPSAIDFQPARGADLSSVEGTLVVFVDGKGQLGPAAAEIDGAMGGALSRAGGADDFKAKAGKVLSFGYPAGLAARRVVLACMGADPDRAAARKTGEYRTGIGRLLARDPQSLPEELRPYLGAVRALNVGGLGKEGLRWYPGSPRLVRSMLRRQDRLVA